MLTVRHHALPIFLAFAAAGCTREAPPAQVVMTPPPSPPPAGDALDQLDTRTAVPLLPMMANHQKQNMRDHLAAVQEIVAALVTDDFTGIEKAASRIGFSEQMGQMCTHMGAGAPGFTEQALAFHHTADRIGDAARKRTGRSSSADSPSPCRSALAAATWKQQVVDERRGLG